MDGPDEFPSVWTGSRAAALDQHPELEQLRCRVVSWANGAQPLKGVVYEAEGTPPSAPLLVKAHGGTPPRYRCRLLPSGLHSSSDGGGIVVDRARRLRRGRALHRRGRRPPAVCWVSNLLPGLPRIGARGSPLAGLLLNPNQAAAAQTGFGDAFAAANIDCQGHDDLDDILTGIEAMESAGTIARGVPCGIYVSPRTLRFFRVFDFRTQSARTK